MYEHTDLYLEYIQEGFATPAMITKFGDALKRGNFKLMKKMSDMFQGRVDKLSVVEAKLKKQYKDYDSLKRFAVSKLNPKLPDIFKQVSGGLLAVIGSTTDNPRRTIQEKVNEINKKAIQEGRKVAKSIAVDIDVEKTDDEGLGEDLAVFMMGALAIILSTIVVGLFTGGPVIVVGYLGFIAWIITMALIYG